MKKLFSHTLALTLTLFFSTLFMGPAMAQVYNPNYGVQARIPFAFHAGEAQLPAGEYTLTHKSIFDNIMEIRSTDGKVDVTLVIEDNPSTTQPQNAELVFDKIGNNEFLREVHVEEMTYQFEMPSLEKHLEQGNQKHESHRIACMSLHKKI